MWYPATIDNPPASEPITNAQVKLQCSIASGDTSRDGIIALLIPAARQAVQNYCGIRLVSQTVSIHCDDFCDFRRVPEAPVKAVSAVTYIDVEGVEQTLATSVYEVRKEGLSPSIVLKHGQRWPSIQPGSRIKVTAVFGWDTIPADIVAALLLSVTKLLAFSRADMMKRKEVVEGIGEKQWGGVADISTALDETTQNLLENYRNWPLA
jgi:uncharacterized phiE125 gp8 family phage protein